MTYTSITSFLPYTAIKQIKSCTLKVAINSNNNSYSSARHSDSVGRKVVLEHTDEGLAAYGSRRRCIGNTLLRYEADCAVAKMSATEVRAALLYTLL
jgi:hypothetical protein